MMALPGTEDRFSAQYGNYIHLPSASIVCFIPAHYIDVQAPGNTNSPFFGTKIVIGSTQTGNGVLARAFRDGGQDLAGIFIDKYQGSNCLADGSGLPNSTTRNPGELPNTGGIFASRPLHWPVSATPVSGTLRSPFSLCNSTALNGAATTPANNLGGVWALCQTRGTDFLPVPLWTYTQIGFLALAHAQALLDNASTPISGATTNAAWMDAAPYAPKGNNNNGSDVNKTSLQFARTDIAGHNGSGWAGEASRAFTGAARISGASAVEHTTHNGQLSGIVDVNGNQWGIAPGLTSVTSAMTAGGYRLLPDSIAWSTIASNANIRSAAGLISLAAESAPAADDGIWHTAANAWAYLQADAGGTFHDDLANSSATLKAMTDCGIPREAGTTNTVGTTATNIYGGDGFFRSLTADCLPRVGGHWGSGSRAGVFHRHFDLAPGDSNLSSGARACRLLSP
jgi:hypothetical protein